jgi:PIN domain nuclease of toxin-antitoxin system
MMYAVTDTHSLIWYLEDDSRLSPRASHVFDACDAGQSVIYIPTICLVEILYLQEKGRIPTDLRTKLDAHLRRSDTAWIIVDLTAAIVEAMARVPREQVPDLPDRVIAATALHLGVPVISKDGDIQLTDVETIW